MNNISKNDNTKIACLLTIFQGPLMLQSIIQVH